jgi:hypothetical protein
MLDFLKRPVLDWNEPARYRRHVSGSAGRLGWLVNLWVVALVFAASYREDLSLVDWLWILGTSLLFLGLIHAWARFQPLPVRALDDRILLVRMNRENIFLGMGIRRIRLASLSGVRFMTETLGTRQVESVALLGNAGAEIVRIGLDGAATRGKLHGFFESRGIAVL